MGHTKAFARHDTRLVATLNRALRQGLRIACVSPAAVKALRERFYVLRRAAHQAHRPEADAWTVLEFRIEGGNLIVRRRPDALAVLEKTAPCPTH